MDTAALPVTPSPLPQALLLFLRRFSRTGGMTIGRCPSLAPILGLGRARRGDDPSPGAVELQSLQDLPLLDDSGGSHVGPTCTASSAARRAPRRIFNFSDGDEDQRHRVERRHAGEIPARPARPRCRGARCLPGHQGRQRCSSTCSPSETGDAIATRANGGSDLIDGQAVAARLRQRSQPPRSTRCATGTASPPGLAAVLVGDDPASRIYVRNKARACAASGSRRSSIACRRMHRRRRSSG